VFITFGISKKGLLLSQYATVLRIENYGFNSVGVNQTKHNIQKKKRRDYAGDNKKAQMLYCKTKQRSELKEYVSKTNQTNRLHFSIFRFDFSCFRNTFCILHS